MTAFTLDTSGHVDAAPGQTFAFTLFDDLSPFERGYVEALFCELYLSEDKRAAENGDPPVSPVSDRFKFYRLAPETLAAIRKDCAGLSEVYSDTKVGGALLWADRQRGSFIGLNPQTRFPPLAVMLGDDGKVRTSPVDGTAGPQDSPGLNPNPTKPEGQ